MVPSSISWNFTLEQRTVFSLSFWINIVIVNICSEYNSLHECRNILHCLLQLALVRHLQWCDFDKIINICLLLYIYWCKCMKYAREHTWFQWDSSIVICWPVHFNELFDIWNFFHAGGPVNWDLLFLFCVSTSTTVSPCSSQQNIVQRPKYSGFLETEDPKTLHLRLSCWIVILLY